MERLTDRKTAAVLKENAEKLQAAGFAVDISNLRYIKLAEYENAEELLKTITRTPVQPSQTAIIKVLLEGKGIKCKVNVDDSESVGTVGTPINFEEDEKMKNICDVKPMPEKMNVMKMTVEDFGRVPYRTKDTDLSEFYSLVILPTEEIHDSGYKCMDFVAIDKDGYPICRLSGCSDVLHLDGIGGYGEYKGKLNNMVVPKGWSIDCLPCGLLRVFSRYMLKPDDMAVSSYCVYSVDGRK